MERPDLDCLAQPFGLVGRHRDEPSGLLEPELVLGEEVLEQGDLHGLVG